MRPWSRGVQTQGRADRQGGDLGPGLITAARGDGDEAGLGGGRGPGHRHQPIGRAFLLWTKVFLALETWAFNRRRLRSNQRQFPSNRCRSLSLPVNRRSLLAVDRQPPGLDYTGCPPPPPSTTPTFPLVPPPQTDPAPTRAEALPNCGPEQCAGYWPAQVSFD